MPAHLVGAVGALIPHAAVQARVLHGHAAREVDDLTDGELDDGTRVGVGGVEDGHAHVGGGVQVDLVRADAKGTDGLQVWARAQDPLGDLRLGTKPQVVHAVEGRDQVVLGEGTCDTGDLDTELREDVVGDGVRFPEAVRVSWFHHGR